ncbi:hypothetical protein GYMLUDRAFT_83975 [Collybiopsis luxurians FD-317 M1]|uniref:Uncharacterized protein n=1 Tax=Collybiopsis luxurians FD-317 M1 TaxID=944289 RepID=A0A0D0BGE9_9AGAR|nr:hypothetical protein GYMLUDRAFT_83975 [Collybiopsis luxurians FD-317 M1]
MTGVAIFQSPVSLIANPTANVSLLEASIEASYSLLDSTIAASDKQLGVVIAGTNSITNNNTTGRKELSQYPPLKLQVDATKPMPAIVHSASSKKLTEFAPTVPTVPRPSSCRQKSSVEDVRTAFTESRDKTDGSDVFLCSRHSMRPVILAHLKARVQQSESPKANVLLNNIRFAIQAVDAKSRRFVDHRRHKFQLPLWQKSATRAYIERREAWFGEGGPQYNIQQKNRNYAQVVFLTLPLVHLQQPDFLTSILPTASASSTNSQLLKRNKSPSLMHPNKRPRRSYSTNETDAGIPNSQAELSKEQIEGQTLQTFAILSRKLLKGKLPMNREELLEIHSFISSSIPRQIGSAMILRQKSGSPTTHDEFSSISEDPDLEADCKMDIWRAILFLAESPVGGLGLGKKEEDTWRRIAKRAVREACT